MSVTFTDLQNGNNICEAEGTLTALITMNPSTKEVIVQGIASAQFFDYIGNKAGVILTPKVLGTAGSASVYMELYFGMTHVSGEVYEERRRIFGDTPFSVSVSVAWKFKSLSTTARKYTVTETSANFPLQTNYNQFESSNFSNFNFFVNYGKRPTDNISKTLTNNKNDYDEKIIEHKFFYKNSLIITVNEGDGITLFNNLNYVKMNDIPIAEPYIVRKEKNDQEGRLFTNKYNESITIWDGLGGVNSKLVARGKGNFDLETQLEFHFDRNLKVFGRVFAFDKPYPDNLKAIVSGLGGTQKTELNIIKGILEPEKYLFEKFYITSIVVGKFKDFQKDTIPSSNISLSLDNKILQNNLDDTSYNRFPFRGHHFKALTLFQASEVPILDGIKTDNSGTYLGNIRDYKTKRLDGSIIYTYKNFNSYRYLDLSVKSKSGNNVSGIVTLELPNDTKKYKITASKEFSRQKIDLCAPINKSSIADTQDNPYPRLFLPSPNFTTDESQEVKNGDYYGVSRVFSISIDNPDIEIKYDFSKKDFGVYLNRKNFTYSNFLAERLSSTNPIKKTYTDVYSKTNKFQYTGRRYWQYDVDGRNEEEWDWGYINTTEVKRTIKDFSDSLAKYHSGWATTSLVAKGDITNRTNYLNSDDGLLYWLGSDGVTLTNPSSKVQYGYTSDFSDPESNYIIWIKKDNSVNSLFRDVLAQTVFDSINGNFVPYYDNAFDNAKSEAPPLFMYLGAAVVLRGRVHGLVLDKDSNNFKVGSGVSITYPVNNKPTDRGKDITDEQGVFYTEEPFGFGRKEHDFVNELYKVKQIIESAKQTRLAIKFRELLTLRSPYISASASKIIEDILVLLGESYLSLDPNSEVSESKDNTLNGKFRVYNVNPISSRSYDFEIPSKKDTIIDWYPKIINQNTNDNNDFKIFTETYKFKDSKENIIPQTLVFNNTAIDDKNSWTYYNNLITRIAKLMGKTENNSFTIPPISNDIYALGIYKKSLILQTTSFDLVAKSISEETDKNLANNEIKSVFIDGEKLSDSEVKLFSNLDISAKELKAINKFYSVVSISFNNLLIIYSLIEEKNKFYFKTYNNSILSNRQILFDISQFVTSSNHSVSNIDCIYDDVYKMFRIVFILSSNDSDSKHLIYTEFDYNSGTIVKPSIFHYVAGDYDKNLFNSNLKVYDDPFTVKLPFHKPTLTINESHYQKGQISIFYVDIDRKLFSTNLVPFKSLTNPREII